MQNTAPWTYLGDRPVHACPQASFDTGLDLLALRVLRVPSTARAVRNLFSRHPDPRGRRVLTMHDVATFTITSTRPMAFQLDGDYVGEREKVHFTAVPLALRVVC